MKPENPMGSTFDAAASRRRCYGYRRRILDISQTVTALHAAGAFSCLEMGDVIYHGLMQPGSNGERFHDLFLMSKGHGCLTQYVILESLGILPSEEIARYCTPQGILGCHPDRGNPGIIASTGSLGHGMGMATGIAYAEKIQSTGRRVFTLLSDGELQEGSTWEAMMMAANQKLENLLAFIDLNDQASLANMSEAHPAFYPLKEKFEAFGWEAAEVNGHDAAAVHAAVAGRKGGRPFGLIGSTVKGRGVSFMERVPIWHYRSPNKDEYQQAVRELKEIGS
jgi:transketolase